MAASPPMIARNPLVRDVALLIARCAVGLLFIVHSLQKARLGFAHTAAFFAHAGIPLAHVAAVYAICAEMLGGVLLILGIAMPLAALLLVADMCGAMTFVHARHGIFVSNGGLEFPLMMAVTSLLLGVIGGGRLSLGWLVASARRGSAEHLAERRAQPVQPELEERLVHREPPDAGDEGVDVRGVAKRPAVRAADRAGGSTWSRGRGRDAPGRRSAAPPP